MMAHGYRGISQTHVLHPVDAEDRNDLVFTRRLGYCADLPIEQFRRTSTLGPNPVDSFSELHPLLD